MLRQIVTLFSVLALSSQVRGSSTRRNINTDLEELCKEIGYFGVDPTDDNNCICFKSRTQCVTSGWCAHDEPIEASSEGGVTAERQRRAYRQVEEECRKKGFFFKMDPDDDYNYACFPSHTLCVRVGWCHDQFATTSASATTTGA